MSAREQSIAVEAALDVVKDALVSVREKLADGSTGGAGSTERERAVALKAINDAGHQLYLASLAIRRMR